MLNKIHEHAMIFYYLLLVILSLLGVITIWMTTSQGIGTTADSANYLAAMRHVEAGQPLLRFTGQPFTTWPPLYPIILALLDEVRPVIGFDLIDMIRLFNGITFGCLIFASGYWFRQLLQTYYWGVLGALGVLFAAPILYVMVFTWTEPLFILVIVLSLIFLGNVSEFSDWQLMIPLLLTVAVATILRYSGIILLLMLPVWLMLRVRTKSILRRAIISGFLSILAALPLLLWMIRNYRLSETLTGQRGVSAQSPGAVFNIIYNILVSWFTTNPLNIGYLDLSVIGCFLTIGVLIYIHRQVGWQQLRISFQQEFQFLTQFAIVFSFFFLYVGLIWYTGSTVPIDLEYRMLSPTYIPLLSILLFFIRIIQRQFASENIARWLIPLSLYVILMLYPLYLGYEGITQRTGTCCQPKRIDWSFVDALQDELDGTPVYSNLYVPLLGVDAPIVMQPRTAILWSATVEDSDAIWIWVNDHTIFRCSPGNSCSNAEYDHPSIIQDDLNLQLLHEDDDVIVYRVSSLSGE